MNISIWRRMIILVAVGPLQFLPSHVKADESLVGQRVLTIRSNVDIERDGRAICRCDVGEPLTIVKDEGQRLDVGIGRIDPSDVLPIDEAMRRFSRQIEAAPTADHYYQRARGHLAREELIQALLDANECLEIQPKHARALALRGECWGKKGRLELAIDNFNEAISADPAEANFYIGRGTAYLLMGEYERAKRDFDESLRRDDRIVAANMGRGHCLLRTGKWPEAIDDITSYLAFVPNDANAYVSRAECYLAIGQFARAAEDMTKCIRLEPDCASHYAERGTVFAVAKEYAKATSDFRTALRLSPQNAKLHYYLGAVLVKDSELDAGLSELDNALTLDPNLADAHLIRAMYWLERKDYRKALADASAGAEKAPDFARGHFLRAMILGCTSDAAIRNGPEAVRAAEKACELTDYNDADCLQCLAAGQAEAGNFDRAVRWQKKAIEVNKDEDKKEGLAEALRLFEQKKPLRAE